MIWARKNTGGSQSISATDRFDKLAADLLSAAEIDFDGSSPLQQALVATFLFGMLFADGKANSLSAGEIRELALVTFQNVLHYSPEAATVAIQQCIDATNPESHDTMNAILHRGIDGHRQNATGDTNGLRQNLMTILEHFATRSN